MKSRKSGVCWITESVLCMQTANSGDFMRSSQVFCKTSTVLTLVTDQIHGGIKNRVGRPAPLGPGLPEASPGGLDHDGMMLSWPTARMCNEAASADLHRGIVEAQCPASRPHIVARVGLVPMRPAGWGRGLCAGRAGRGKFPKQKQKPSSSKWRDGARACLAKRSSTQNTKASSRIASEVLANARQRINLAACRGPRVGILTFKGPVPIDAGSLGAPEAESCCRGEPWGV